jgi:uncharacterized membrane protein YphA (DoxX/SURF4 family)
MNMQKPLDQQVQARASTESLGRALLLGSSIPLGLWLFASGVTKLFSPGDFLRAILDYDLLAPSLAWTSAMLLPFVEIVCGLCLIASRTRPSAALLASVLGLVFVFAQVQAKVRGLDIACGCFELLGREPIGPKSIARAAILALWSLAIALASLRDRSTGTQPTLIREPSTH